MAMSCSPRRHGSNALAAAMVFLAAPWPAKAQPQFEHNYALVVGIDVYAAPRWPRLRAAVSDAQAIADCRRPWESTVGFRVMVTMDVKQTDIKLIQ